MGDLGGRYAAHTTRLLTAVLTTPGDTAEQLRRAVLARARALTPGREDLPPALQGYVDKVAQHAYKVTDDDVVSLQRGGGGSDDALFEITVAAAVGAAVGRLERGLAALRPKD